MAGSPILFTLYGDDDEVKETYSRARIPVSFVERAVELANNLKDSTPTQETLMSLYQLIVDFYGGKFTIEELRAGADFGEMYAVLLEIVSRVSDLMPNDAVHRQANPTKPG